ncbi:DoxX family protein [Chitinophaga sp.]|uniref:DoxX family protein n=1 Tax=Chitinophaga sp. TaxID=1869181 RepID=UPI0031D07026
MSGYQRILFRFFFIYFVLQAVPFNFKYFERVPAGFGFRSLFYISRYMPGDSFATWGIIAIIALAGTIIWSLTERKNQSYEQLYYWLRVILRYRLAAGIIAYGLLKVFPQQMPFPSISQLNTHYGDFTAWKLFAISTGIVPSMESFLGLVETTAGLLLLSRRTAPIGAGIILTFTGNVFLSNLAYEGGEYVYSLYLISMAVFLIVYDLQRIISLISLQQPTAPDPVKPQYKKAWLRYAGISLKLLFIFFFVGVYGITANKTPYQYPLQAGLSGAAGIYNVDAFKYKGATLPYSLTDSIRWKDVVFENWATLSVSSNQTFAPDLSNTEEIYDNDADRNFESSGNAGRRFYTYVNDTAKHILYLQNKNNHYKDDRLLLHYERPDSNTIILYNDSLHVVLSKLNKKYPLIIGRRKPLKL